MNVMPAKLLIRNLRQLTAMISKACKNLPDDVETLVIEGVFRMKTWTTSPSQRTWT
jgi:hypothetical protein